MNYLVEKAARGLSDLLPSVIKGAEVEFFAKAKITNSQFIVLMALYHLKRCTMGQLAKTIHVEMPTATGLVDRLIRLGYIKRESGIKDRRKIYIYVTTKGLKLISGFKAIAKRRWRKILQHLNKRELKSFSKIINKLSLYLKEMNI